MSSTQGRTFTTFKLGLPGKTPVPTTIPLIVRSNFKYNSEKNQLEEVQEELERTGHRPSLRLLPDAISLLRTIDKPVAVVAVCGPYRTGKSYLLSRILGVSDAFQLGHTTSACTHGIWMATQVLECDEFALLLLDTEGIDAVSGTGSTDASILVMAILLSSYLIYNSVHVPTKNDLEKMSCFTQISQSIIVRQGEDSDMSDFRDHFPSFVWLLRDSTLQTVSETGEELSPTDYLKTQILHRSKKSLPTRTDLIAMAILSYFPSVECQVLPPPSADATVLQNISLNEHKLSLDFNTCMQNFVQHVRQEVSTKKGFTTNSVDGSTLALLAETYIEAVNDPESSTTLEGSWDVVVSQKLKDLQEKLVGEYKSEMEAILNDKMPVELYPACEEDGSVALFTVHKQIFGSKWNIFEDEVNCLMPHGIMDDFALTKSKREKALHDFECQIVEYDREAKTPHRIIMGGILKQFIDENIAKSTDHCCKLIHQLLDSILRQRMRAIHTTTHGASNIPVGLVMEIKERYYAEACGPAKDHAYISELSTLQCTSKHLMQVSSAYNTLQCALDEEGTAQSQVNESSSKLYELQCELKRNENELSEYEADCNRNIEKLRSREEEILRIERMKQDELMQSAMSEAVQASQEKCQDLQKASEKQIQEMRQLQDEMKEQQKKYLDQLKEALEKAKEEVNTAEQLLKKQKQVLTRMKEDAKGSTRKQDVKSDGRSQCCGITSRKRKLPAGDQRSESGDRCILS